MLDNRFLLSILRFKELWLTPVVLIFFISAIFSLVQLRQSITILDNRYGTSVWSLFQLKTELHRFNDTLTIYRSDNTTYGEVTARYDILWSRFPVLLEGIDANQLVKIEGALPSIQSAFDQIKALEPSIFTQLKHTPSISSDLQQKLEPHIRSIEKLALDNYHFNNDFYNRGDRRVSELQQQLIWLMVGLIMSGTLLLILIIRENSINRFQAEHDSLTGIPNRAFFRRELTRRCEGDEPFALHLIDLNGFKDVNDTLGHHTGDLLLKSVSDRLTNCLDQTHDCLTCRLGGDEFAILQPHVNDTHELDHIAAEIIQLLEEDFRVEEHQCLIGASIGSVQFPNHGDNASSLLTRADIAMYKAKESAPFSRHQIFDFIMDEQINRRQILQMDLREAIEHHKLHLAYQPIIDLKNGRPVYLEALLRWEHPIYGFVSPLEIIEVAEQHGIANTLGYWIICEACRQIREWSDNSMKPLPVAVNISPSMHRPELGSLINQALEEHNVPHGLIWIEVTEDTTIQMIQETQRTLPLLKKSGIHIALDDFGTGLSSLSHLQQLPVQTLKIDRSFIKKITQNQVSWALVKNMITIGHDLGMHVVAEGIEHREEAELLTEHNCDMGQGYLFSKPLTPEDIISFCNSPQDFNYLHSAAINYTALGDR